MKLRAWLEKESLTQAKLAAELNVNVCLLWLWAKGKRVIGPKTLKLLREITKGEVSEKGDVIS